MGWQSSRLSYEKKDHKDIFFRGKLHDAMYLGNKLVWQKLYYNIFLCYDSADTGYKFLVEIDTKRVFKFIGELPQCLIGKKKYLHRGVSETLTKREYHIVNEMVFYKSTGGFNMKLDTLCLYKPYAFGVSSTLFNVTHILVGNDDSVNEELYSVNVPEISSGYHIESALDLRCDKSNYFYSIEARNDYGENPVLYRLNGKVVEELILKNYSSYRDVYVDNPVPFYAIGNYLYLGVVKYLEDEADNHWLTIFTILVINNMQIESEIAIASRKSNHEWKDTTNPYIHYFHGTCWVARFFGTQSFQININGSNVDVSEITGEIFSVDLYEDGKKTGNIAVTTKSDVDFSTLSISLFAILGGDRRSGVYDLHEVVDYTPNGFEENAWHNVLYDESGGCFYIFYLKYLYDSDENFCIRVNKEA